MAERNSAAQSTDAQLVIERVFDAPPTVVFKAWTQVEHLVRWWGPHGFTTPVCTIDARPGGIIRFCMRSPEGRDYWNSGVFREVNEPERLVFTLGFSDADGKRVSPTVYGMSVDFPSETIVTVTFAEQGGKTKLRLEQSFGKTVPERDGAREGWSESFDRLAEYAVRA